MLPFDNLLATRLQKRDQHRPCIPVPQKPDSLLPAPISYEKNALYEDGEDTMKGQVGALGGAFQQFNSAKGITSFAAVGGYENELLSAGPF